MYKLTVSPLARKDIAEFLSWLTNYSAEKAAEFEIDLGSVIVSQLLERPHTWPHFFLTGSPYRSYLYNVSRRTSYWIVYTIDEDNKVVKLLRFWNSARDPTRFIV